MCVYGFTKAVSGFVLHTHRHADARLCLVHGAWTMLSSLSPKYKRSYHFLLDLLRPQVPYMLNYVRRNYKSPASATPRSRAARALVQLRAEGHASSSGGGGWFITLLRRRTFEITKVVAFCTLEIAEIVALPSRHPF